MVNTTAKEKPSLVKMKAVRKCFGEVSKDTNMPAMYLPGEVFSVSKEIANKWNDAGVAKVVIE